MNRKSSFPIFFFALVLIFSATSCTRYVMVIPATSAPQRVVAVSPQQHPVVMQGGQQVAYGYGAQANVRQRRPISISAAVSVGSNPYGNYGYGQRPVIYGQGNYGQPPIINGGMIQQRPVVYPGQQAYPYQQNYPYQQGQYQQSPYYQQAGYRPNAAWYYTGY